MSPHIRNRHLLPADLPLVSKLHAKVFGPGRFVRTAYRIREGTPRISPFCRAAFDGDRVIAAVRFTEITIGGKGGALLLGPLAVDPEYVNRGYGRALIGEGLAQAKEAGIKLVLLVGDEPYYGRFDFRPIPPGQLTLPGPVDPRRLLAVELAPGSMSDYRGMVAGKAVS
jgi:predicted N-acetyltransferase YhbS